MKDTKQSGQYFIAYSGTEISHDNIISALKSICPKEYTVKKETIGNTILAKISHNEYIYDREPYYHEYAGLVSVSGYNQDEIKIANIKSFNSWYYISDPDHYHFLIPRKYGIHGTRMFKELKDYMHFCSVIWSRANNTLFAGVTKPNNQYTHLYYGYTKQKHELIFSNNENILNEFCDEITEMQENTYMKNGELFTIYGEKIEQVQTNSLIKKKLLK